MALDEVLQRFPEWEVDWDNAKQARTSTVRGWEAPAGPHALSSPSGSGGLAVNDDSERRRSGVRRQAGRPAQVPSRWRSRTPEGVPPPEVTTAVRAPATWRSPASWRSWAMAS